MKSVPMLILAAIGAMASVVTASAQYIRIPQFSLLQAEQAAGRRIFSDHCASCHMQKSGAQVVFGPSLAGVVGRRAGSLKEFPYSEALKKSGLVWTEDNLRKWIADSKQMIPNTLMPHVSISDSAEQLYLVAYLKALKSSGAR